MRRRSPQPFPIDFDDLSGEVQDEDDEVTMELRDDDEGGIDPDFDALFPDDDPPTVIKRPNGPGMPAGRRLSPYAPLPALPPTPPPAPVPVGALEMTSPAVRGAYYSAPRPPPASYQPQPGNSTSIAPVMLASAEASPPARSWQVFLGAALVGCAAVAVATVPLLLKGYAFHEATTTYVVAAPVAPPPARKVVKPRSNASEDTHVPGGVVSIDDLPVAPASIDDLPVVPDDHAASLPPARPAASTKAPPRPAASSKRAKREASKAPRDASAQSVLKAALEAPAAPPAPAADQRSPVAETDATLHVVSTPPANVAVDGRPLGMTPQSVKLAAGPHVVVFAGAEAREVRQVDLSAGGAKTVSVSF